MSRPAWMTDELEEEWVEPEWDDEPEEHGQEISQRSQRSPRNAGTSKVQRSPHVYGSVRVASASPGSGSDAGASMRERSIRGLLELGDDGKRKTGLATERPAPPSGVSTLDTSPVAGTFLVREDIPAEPLKAAPAALKKSGVKDFFTPLALERMFEPPSPPPDSSKFVSQPQPEPQVAPQSQPRPVPRFDTPSNSVSTNIRPTATVTRTSTSPTSLAPKHSPGNTTPSPHASPAHTDGSSPSLSPSIMSTFSEMSMIPSPSAGRGPLGTFRLPHRHAPLRPSRLSESHLVKPYASFEADESSRSSILKDILADVSNIQREEKPSTISQDPNTPSRLTTAIEDDDEERFLTNDFDFGDEELLVGDDGECEDGGRDEEVDSILDASSSDIGKQVEQVAQESLGAQQPENSQPNASNSRATQPDEILDTDIPGLTLFDGRKLSANYQFTFAAPLADESKDPDAKASSRGQGQDKRTREDRKREREAERERRNVTRALLHPHNALRPITPDTHVESRSSSRASSHNDDPPLRDGNRTPSPSMVPRRDPRLKLFHFQYDTFTRDHLSALVDSIAVGSVGSSPSVQVNTMEFRGEDPRALSTPSDAVRYAKKIKLTPPEEFSDWDGESAEEQAENEGEGSNGAEAHPRPLSVGKYYANDARNLMLAMRAARSFDGESALSTAQQSAEQEDEADVDQEHDLSSGSAANDYRRRGADLMAQLREELSDEEDGSVREGSMLIRGDGSSNGGSIVVQSLGTLQTHNQPGLGASSPSSPRVDHGPKSPSCRNVQLLNTQNQDPVNQLSSSIHTMELNDQAQEASKSSPRKLLRRLSVTGEAPRVAGRAGLSQPPLITIADASPEPPRERDRHPARGRMVSGHRPRIQSPGSASPTSTHPPVRFEPQHPPSPTRHDMNRFVSSSSTAHTRSTARSAGSFVKHAGPPIPGVRQIVPSDLPAEALPERVGRMVYDRVAMRWRQEVDGNASESEDPFRDFDSFASNAADQESDGEGSQPMGGVDEHEVEQEVDPRQGPGPDPNITLNDATGMPATQETPETTVEYDSDVSTELNVVNVGETSPHNDIDTDDMKLYEPSPKAAPAELWDPELPQDLDVEHTGVGITPARISGPLRPALKGATSTPADSAGPTRPTTAHSTPMSNGMHNRRSVSFSDGRMSGKIRGLSIRDITNDTPSEATSLTLTPLESEAAPSSRMQRIGNLLDALEDDSVLANLSIAPGKQPPGESDEEETSEEYDIGQGDPDVDPDVSRNPRAFARTYSFGGSERTGSKQSASKGNATFLTECSFGIAHDRLVELITDVHPYQPYWEPLSEIDLSKKAIESLARLKEFLPNLDRLNVHGNELAYLSGVPTCLRELNAAQNQLTSLTSYAHLTNLEVLDISNNQVDSIAQLKCLRHLRELSAAGNTISDLSGIAHTTSLVKLNLKGNCIKSVSFEDCSWPHIDSIDLSDNGMKSIVGLSSLPTLATLNLDHNALTNLCIDVPLSRLKHLRLSDNKLTELDCSPFTNLRTLYVDNNRLGNLRHIEKARRLENLSLRNQSGRGLHLSVSHFRDIKRLYLSGNPLDPGFLEVPCYNLVYLELAACRLSTLPSDLSRLVPNLRVLNLNYNFLSDARPLSGLMRLRKLTAIGSRLKATKPLLRSLQSMKELEMLDFRMNPFSLGWYLPLLVRDVPGALQPSETNGKNGMPWSELDVKFRRDLPDELYIGRLAYRGLVMRVCPHLRIMDGIEITSPERAKAQKLLLGIEKSHKANSSPAKD